MTSISVRVVRGVIWLILIFSVLMAVTVTGLRLLLPHLDNYRQPIEQWVSKQANVSLQIDHIDGRWQATGPALTLSGLTIAPKNTSVPVAKVGQLAFSFEIWQSLLHLRPIFESVEINKLNIDLTKLEKTHSDSSSPNKYSLETRLEQLFFTQLGNFHLSDSSVIVRTESGRSQQLDISSLNWLNQQGRHLAQGSVSLPNSHLGQLVIQADLDEKGGLSSLSGTLYIKGQDVLVTPWLNKQFSGVADITNSSINLEAWLDLKNGRVTTGKVKINDSRINWHNQSKEHQLTIKHGVMALVPMGSDEGQSLWRVNTANFDVTTDGIQWPKFDVSAQFSINNEMKITRWKAALSQIALERLLPLSSFFSKPKQATQALAKLKPSGIVNNIRVAGAFNTPMSFSFDVNDLSFKQWSLAPGFNKLNASVAGDTQQGRIKLNLNDDSLPYGNVFAKSLQINQADITAYWQHDKTGTVLWSDQLNVETPDLETAGKFRIDFPTGAPTWLSFYGEVSLKDAGQTWRYLPRPALGNNLTDYLARAIKGGTAKSAQLLWYGALDAFPYSHHNGIFEVIVPLRKAKFSFDPKWPLLTDLDLDLSFKNNMMYLVAPHVKTMGATGTNLVGEAELSKHGHLKLDVDLAAKGSAVRDYMLATPLANSVGAALKTVQVSGPVTAKLSLDIPFDGSQVDAKGVANFNGNHIALATPPLNIEKVSGQLSFDNAKINAKDWQGQLFSQPIDLSFHGAPMTGHGYNVNVAINGNWKIESLKPYLKPGLLDKVSGSSAWQGDVNVNINDKDVNYKVGVKVPLDNIESQLPYPLHREISLQQQYMTVKATGNDKVLYGQALLPNISYQVRLNLDHKPLMITASHLSVGKQNLELRPLTGNTVKLSTNQFDLDSWIGEINTLTKLESAPIPTPLRIKSKPVFTLPLPDRITANVGRLTLGGLQWHNVAVTATHAKQWVLNWSSREVSGGLTWSSGQPVYATLKKLDLNVPALANFAKKEQSDNTKSAVLPSLKATSLDHQLIANIPSIDLAISDAWLQGYRLGQVRAKLTRVDDGLELNQFKVNSGHNQLSGNGRWLLHDNRNYSRFDFTVQGDNSSTLLKHLGMDGGISDAKFKTDVSLEWQGAPWSMVRNTLDGKVNLDIGDGLIDGVSGAGRLLGLFSLDSIIRKMKMDFSGVFDDGLPFNYIRGSGAIHNGVFESNNIKMKAQAGDMYINGMVDLVSDKVDANVKFIPDFTSGLPVLTAFAVAPPVALAVFAASAVLSPVLDVITQVNYQVTGPLTAPKVVEVSRLSGEHNNS